MDILKFSHFLKENDFVLVHTSMQQENISAHRYTTKHKAAFKKATKQDPPFESDGCSTKVDDFRGIAQYTRDGIPHSGYIVTLQVFKNVDPFDTMLLNRDILGFYEEVELNTFEFHLVQVNANFAGTSATIREIDQESFFLEKVIKYLWDSHSRFDYWIIPSDSDTCYEEQWYRDLVNNTTDPTKLPSGD